MKAKVDIEKLMQAYGCSADNWGDLPNFQGDYINFGYWENIPLDKPLTINDRIKSSDNLYKHVIDQLSILPNDVVLEIGCGRGAGITNLFNHYTAKKIIGIDITAAQIERTKILMGRKTKEKQDLVNLLVASADSIPVESQSVDKIYMVEVAQHFGTFQPFAKEIKRILRPNGILVFAAHLSTSQEGFNMLRQSNLIIEDGADVLLPINEAINAFKELNFGVMYNSIGEKVFSGYERWISQVCSPTPCSHNIYKAYKSGYIDYYVVTARL